MCVCVCVCVCMCVCVHVCVCVILCHSKVPVHRCACVLLEICEPIYMYRIHKPSVSLLLFRESILVSATSPNSIVDVCIFTLSCLVFHVQILVYTYTF